MSLRTRLTLWLALAATSLVVAAGTLVWVAVGQQLRLGLDETIRLHAESVATALEADPNAPIDNLPSGRPAAFTILYGSDGVPIRRTGMAAELPAVPPPGLSELVVENERYVFYAVDGAVGRVVTGATTAGIEATQAAVTQALVAVGLFVAVVAVGGSWWLVGRVLAPLSALAAELETIEPDELDRPFVGRPGRDEVGRLTRSIADLLARLDEDRRRQQAFVAAASHDLRTPLAALRTELELALRGRSDARRLRRAIEAAHGDAVRLGQLADGLLALAEAEPGGRPLTRSRVSVEALLEAAVDDCRSLADGKGVAIEVAAPAAEVAVDRVRLEQALRNIVANAVRYSPEGATVRIVAEVMTRRLRPGLPGRPWLRVGVVDRGPGVDPAVEGRLFLPFVRRHGDGEGTGLGLAIAAAAVRAHSGEIGYRPAAGGGSEFWLAVPC
ncbi:MAG TPA: HAMP domain-containing sensor histidine kinase [Candidatus Binatia bacterium]|nr:HAMP domain-containing sensor histidine kinase [Candidatus Binatia bacterium]